MPTVDTTGMAPAQRVIRTVIDSVDHRVYDVAYGLVVGLIGYAGSDGPNPWSPFPRPLAVAAGIAGGTALWWRRRHPMKTSLFTVATAAVSANPLPALLALFSAGARRVDAELLALMALATFAFAVPGWFDGGFDPSVVGLLGGFATMAFPIGVGMYMSSRREAAEAAEARAVRAESEREFRVEEARLAERARIAREMHDVLAHKVSLVALHAGVLAANPSAGAGRVGEEAAVIRQAAVQALDELRSVLSVLHQGAAGADDRLAPQPGYDAIGPLVEASRAAGVPVDLHLGPVDLPPAMGRTAYRVVQEALTNVHKHAGGAPTTVAVTGGVAGGVTIAVTNGPGPGAPGLPGSGTGLVGLAERVRLAGGTLDHGAETGGGWRVVAWLPWVGTLDDPAGGEPPVEVGTT